LLYYWADRVTFCIEESILKEVDCDDSGEIKEFVGCKIAYNAEMRTLKLHSRCLYRAMKMSSILQLGMKSQRLLVCHSKHCSLAQNRFYKESGIPISDQALGNSCI
jgi:hypothetical protein